MNHHHELLVHMFGAQRGKVRPAGLVVVRGRASSSSVIENDTSSDRKDCRAMRLPLPRSSWNMATPSVLGVNEYVMVSEELTRLSSLFR